MPTPELHEDHALDQLEQQVGTLNDRLASFETKFQTLARSNEQLYGLLKSCTSQLYQSLHEVGQHKDRLASALARQRELEALNLAQQREAERASTRLRALEAAADARTRGTDSTLRELAEVEGALTARVLELDRRAVEAQRECVERAERLAAAEQHCADLEALAQRQADELLELRQQAQQRQQQQHATQESASVLERSLSERIAELVAELARRDDELRQQAQQQQQQAAQESASVLERSLSERIAELVAELARRDDELRQHLEARSTLESRAWEREQSQSARIAELQKDLAQFESQLRERSAAAHELGNELADRNARCEERSRRCAELEEELRMQVEEQRVLEQRAREVEQELTGRLHELEARADTREVELRERAATLEELRAALASDAGKDQVLSHHSTELAGQLAAREEELQLLRSESAQLAEHGQSLSRALDARGTDLQARELELAEASSRIDDLECADARREAQHAQELAFVDELAEGRIASYLPGQPGGAAEPLPPAYLEGLEKRDLGLALRALLGGTAPLSISSMLRLGDHWRSRHEAWKSEPIQGEVAYLWAEAPFVRAGLEPDGAALLVVVAGLVDGSRRVVAVEAGLRDSASTWRALLEDLVRRGMNVPRLVVGEDGMGLWPALKELGWDCAQQRCWSRRIEHVVEALPAWRQRKAGERLRAITKAETPARAGKLKDAFVRQYRVRHPEAVARLQSDWEQMLSLYTFPAEHWPQLRTTAVVESLLGVFRLRTSLAKPYPSTPNALAIMWKLLHVGARGLRRLPESSPAVKAKRARKRAA